MSRPPSGRMRAAPAISPSDAAHGLMCAMLMLRTASACSTGHEVRARVHNDRGLDVGRSRGRPPRLYRSQRVRVHVTRLPIEVRKPLCKPGRMLSCAARDLKNGAVFRQPVGKHLCNRLAVAKRRGSRPASVRCRRSLVETALVHLLCRLGRLRILVDQHRLARRQRLVEAAARRMDRRGLERLDRPPSPARRASAARR